MSETSLAPERPVPASEFLITVEATGGNPAAIHTQYPQLTTRFVGEYTPLSDTPDSPEAPMPYSHKFLGYRPEAEDVIRTRGTFNVTRGADGHRLTFQSGSSGDVYSLGDVSKQTAQAFKRYGPTYTEVDLTITNAPPEQDRQPFSASLTAIVGVQETLTEIRELAPEEILQVEGFVQEYDPSALDQRPKIGEIALHDRSVSTRYNPDKNTRLVVQLPNGELIAFEPRYAGTIHYREAFDPSALTTPSKGDTVQVLVKNTPVHLDYPGQGCFLEPLAVQLQEPSAKRKQYNALRQTTIEFLVDTFGENQNGINQQLEELLATAFYRRGDDARFSLTPQQQKTIADRLEAAYVSDPNSIPAIIAALRTPSNDLLGLAAEAVTEGFSAFTMSKVEMAKAAEDIIATRPKYSRQTSMQNSFNLLAKLLPTETRLEVAQRAWARFRDEPAGEDVIEQRVYALRNISSGIFTQANATLVGEITLWDKLSPSEAIGLLIGAINSLLYDEKEPIPSDTMLGIFGAYYNTYQKLHARLERIDSTIGDRFNLASLEESVRGGAAHCYDLAHKQGII